jgi:hypothetical protein
MAQSESPRSLDLRTTLAIEVEARSPPSVPSL